MKFIKQFSFLIICCCFGMSLLKAQVTIIPVHQNSEIFLFDQLFQVNVLNVSGITQTGFLEISIEDRNRSTVVTVRSAPMNLQQGAMRNGGNINWQNNARFGNNIASGIISETGKLPIGEYVICYRFLGTTTQTILGVNCQEKAVKPFGLPELISPYNRETINTKLPLLTWRPPLPSYNLNVQYSLKLTERKEGQSMNEALLKNFPLVQQNRLSQTALIYPSASLPLKVGKTYVWQVSAGYDNIEIGQTDIWQFTYGEQAEARQQTARTTYATLKRKLDATFFQMEDGFLRFQVQERYNADDIEINIYNYKREKKALNEIAEAKNNVNHQFGTNYYEINVTCALVINEFYVLEVQTQSNEKTLLRFKHFFNIVNSPGCQGQTGDPVGTGGF